jgi:hypothetical protein
MMRGYLDSIRLLGVTLTPEQHVAFTFLESRGLRFLVHFGLSNAIEKANGFCDFETKH